MSKFQGTTVEFDKRSDGALIAFRAYGHAGYAPEGHDIVCAAISALTQTVMNGLKNVQKLPIMFEQDDDGAFFETALTPEATQQDVVQAQILMITLLEGLQAIQREYPRNLRIIFRERR